MASAETERVRVGVVGCGPVGTVHARAYLDNPAAEFVGVCDIDAARAAEVSRRLRVPGYTNLDELVERGRPDLVSVVVPYNKTVEPVSRCLEAGLHVLSEKPISFDAGEILSLIELAESRGVQFGADFNQRYTHASRWFTELREAGQFGRYVWALGYYGQSSGPDFYMLREKMIHLLDLWRFHLGEVHSVTAQAQWDDEGRKARSPVVLAATLQFASGAVAAFTTGGPRVGDFYTYYELVGEKGRGYCENCVGRAVFRPKDGPPQFRESPWIGPGGSYWDTVRIHLDHVVESLAQDRAMPVPASAAMEVQAICDAVAKSVELGRRVDVAPFRPG